MDDELTMIDYEAVVEDEVALEGLDGITLSALWTRLLNRPNFNMTLDNDVKKYFWNICVRHSGFQFYELPEPRLPLVVITRPQDDDDEDAINDIDETVLNIYPFCEINEPNVFGSCSTFYSRVNITNEVKGIGTNSHPLSFEEVDSRWGNKLVILASTDLRRKALLGDEIDPLWQCFGLNYILLERIGRSRYQGEFTCGRNSLADLNSCAKSLFYYRITLLNKGIINKQFRYYKNKDGLLRCVLLLHLSRFYVEHKPRMVKLTEEICKFLLDKPGRMDTMSNIMNSLGPMKRETFKKCLKKIADIKTMSYEDLLETTGRTSKEVPSNKNVNVAVLFDNITLENLDLILEGNMIKEAVDEESLDEMGNCFNKKNVYSFGVPDFSNQIIDKSILRQAYELFNQLGTKGASVLYLGHLFGVPRLESRMICNNLQRLKLVAITRRDVGRQRVSVYVAKNYVTDSRQEIYKECKKLLVHLSNEEVIVTPKKMSDENMLKNKLKELIKANERKDKSILKPEKPNESMGNKVEENDENISEKDAKQNIDRTNKDDEFSTYLKFTNSTPILEDILLLLNNNTRSTSSITVKTLKRINIILQAVRKAKMIDSHVTLYKLIVNEEAESQDALGKMALKSFQRLLGRLNYEGYIKIVYEVIKCGDREKQIYLICDSSLNSSDPMILSALEQAKLKFLAAPNVVIVETKGLDDIHSSIAQLRNLHKKGKDNQTRNYDPSLGRFYGYEPKFIRCRLLHEFLFYLTFGYEGKNDVNFLDETFDCDTSNLPKMYYYNSEPSWKMFVAPLPEHYGWGQGWCLMSDVLLRLPLSLLIRIVCYNFKIVGIEEYVDHPIKKHIPICYLPLELRNQLLFSRKYIHSTYECAQKLYYMGLLSFGPSEHKSKDMVFLYVHRKSRVVDTTSSQGGYHKVAENIDYPIRKYELDSVDDVESFWRDLEAVCRNTPLGSTFVTNHEENMVEIELVEKKIQIKSVTPTEISEVDTGVAPGDHLGAGGLDSSFFAHLHRSWNWAKPLVKSQKLKASKMMKKDSINLSKSASVRWKNDSQEELPNAVKSRLARLVIKKQLQDTLPDNKILSDAKQTNKLLSNTGSVVNKNKSKVLRQIKPRQIKRPRAPMYDEKDLKALAGVRSRRVHWHPKEDSLLLLCKVAYVLMFDNRKNGFSCRLIRDFLQSHCEKSHDKTALSCARRINYMLKNLQTGYHISVYVGESRQDKEISVLCDGLSSLSPVTDKEIFKERFEVIMDRLMAMFKSTSQPPSNTVILSSSLKELHDKYIITFAKDYWGKSSDSKDVETVGDITAHLAYSLILSAVAGFTSDEKQLSVQLYDVFKRFPDSILLDALTRLKSSGIICCKKPKVRRKEVTSSPVFGTLTYRLSIQYINLLRCNYPENVYSQINDMVHQLISNASEKSEPQEIVVNHLAGYSLAIAAFATKKKIEFEVIVPDEIVMLAPLSEEGNAPKSSKGLIENAGEGATNIDGERLDGPPQKRQRVEATENTGVVGDNEIVKPAQVESDNDNSSKSGKRQVDDVEEGANKNDGEKLEEPAQKKHKLETCENTDAASLSLTPDSHGPGDGAHNVIAFKPVSKSSRFALHMLRQNRDVVTPKTVQHTQDYLIIKSCIVKCKLIESQSDAMKIEPKLKRDISELLPLKAVTLNDIINRYNKLGKTELEIQEMVDIYNMINGCGKLGIHLKNLKQQYISEKRTEESLNNHLEEMQSVKGILCVGVATLRYVTHAHISHWQLRSYQSLSSTSSNQSGPDSQPSVANLKNRVEVSFIPSAWRRPDGTLNFPVYRQLLLSILGRILCFPGVSFEKLYAHYKNVFTPVQLRELLNILMELRCVDICPKPAVKPGLFSSFPGHTPVVNADEWSFTDGYESNVEGPQLLASYLDSKIHN
ncbi:hypothetical protein CHUAL_002359 [Chamberlinius hualienensis]